MTTTWINKDKFNLEKTSIHTIKKENFRTIEEFSDTLKNPLTTFLKTNPLKIIFNRETIDSRNEPFENQTDENQDNIKPLKTEGEEEEPEEPEESEESETTDKKRIKNIMISLFSLFITIYVSYNWYFNITEGFSKRIQFYEKFDFVNYLYFFSEYFYKIVKLFDETISIKTPSLVGKIKEGFFKDRSIFVLILVISNFIVKSVSSFLRKVYKQLKSYLRGKKTNFLKIIYDPKRSNPYISLAFFYFVIAGIISSFASGIAENVKDSLDPKTSIDPSSSFKESMLSFKVAHPLTYLILIIIRISIVYGPTISLATACFFLYYNFYSLFGIPNYLYLNSDPIDSKNLYSGVREGSFIEMFRRIQAVININHVFREIDEDETLWFLNKAEAFLRSFFVHLPFIIMFSGLFKVIPDFLKISTPSYKWSGIAIISVISGFLFKFMLEESPKVYILQEWLKNELKNTVNAFSEVFSKIGKV